MPGVVPPSDASTAPPPPKGGSPAKKSRLSLKFFQKKDPKRALDFAEGRQGELEEAPTDSDQVVPAVQPSSPDCCEKKESLLPFAGLSNLGNTCYLNSVLQVLYYCPGFTTGVKQLFQTVSKKKAVLKSEKDQIAEKASKKDDLPASYELICSLHSLMLSIEQLQTSYLVNPEKFADELAAQPRRLLNTLRELNPMYEGYQQHDAQEVLQCILGYIEETCQLLKKEDSKCLSVEETIPVLPKVSNMNFESEISNETDQHVIPMAHGRADDVTKETLQNENGKRKSDTEAGNAKKKSKCFQEPKLEDQSKLRRSKRRSPVGTLQSKPDASIKSCTENESTRPTEKKSRLSWLKSSGKQPSILSKFCSLGKLSTSSGTKTDSKETHKSVSEEESVKAITCQHLHENSVQAVPPAAAPIAGKSFDESPAARKELDTLELVEKLFQGQLVLRTRCLECECFTERREDFQDISVPVQEDDISKVEASSEISPDPKTDVKCLKWAISQFASVERIVGEDKYFCENCHHYTEAERSLLFDKLPEVITIHLKCFAASGIEFDSFGGLSKINTPLLTPLKLSLEEWSTKPTSDFYGLFAVVMHSGVTISSGHYTAYVKITDLNSLEIDTQNFIVDQMHEMIKSEPQKEEARSGEYDDGEVSFKAGSNVPLPNKTLGKKNTDSVGLLGGQKSKMEYETINSKASNSDKVMNTLPENKNSDFLNANGKENELCQNSVSTNVLEKRVLHAIQGLKEYEGKWLLFDDSEVRVTEESDFLASLSPTTTSTSTPYLLFYRKVAG
ncbi:ubiquitin carboxyl-terminal hydrolase 1 [Pleurodeles waltl]|uniref:ubiquitin carboxyl-terminal hydrolase 1 n=1 Tax=Pleurodeles waltl TaxID=8319 RepID=UPI00370971EB